MTEKSEGKGTGRQWLRYLPILAIAIGAVLGIIYFGQYLSFEKLAENREALLEWRARNGLWAGAAFVGVYVLVVAFSVPGAVWLTIGGGFLFGTVLATGLTVFGATVGACILFLIARSSLGKMFSDTAGPWLSRVRGEFEKGEISFLLVMRLLPGMPFFVANLIPAFLNARFFNYLWTTALGIIPATLVFSSIGAGIGTQLAAGEEPDLGVLTEPHILGPLLGLAALAALPAVIRRLRKREQKA